ncbi:hypothetical protein [Haloarchaeobius sp. TZWSO28]|uniref:hypothetical protein n=1 Tax=unclassified Haloarchaeobius TaxID=2614452 RepID=UPI003EBF71CC
MHETRGSPRSLAGSVVRLTAILLGLALVVPVAFLAWYLGIVVADLFQAQFGLQYGLWFHVVTAAVFVVELALVATVLVVLFRLATKFSHWLDA